MIRRCLRVGIMTALGLVASACNKPSGAEAVKVAEGLADAMCACKDIACATKVGEDGAKELRKYPKPDEKQDEAIKAAGLRAKACLDKLTMPPEPPPAPPPAPPPEGATPPAGAPPATPPPPGTPPAAPG